MHTDVINDNGVLNTFLRHGVTTMKDPGHPFRFYQSLNFAMEQLPRVYLTGAHLDAYPGVYTQQALMVEDYQALGFKKMLQFVGMAHRAGVKIVTGSHTSGKYVAHGWAYQRKMELLVEAGMDPLEVIASSTIDNAAYFRSSDRIGSLEPGKLADLVIVEGDPSTDISKMYGIRKVMLNGRWVDDSKEP